MSGKRVTRWANLGIQQSSDGRQAQILVMYHVHINQALFFPLIRRCTLPRLPVHDFFPAQSLAHRSQPERHDDLGARGLLPRRFSTPTPKFWCSFCRYACYLLEAANPALHRSRHSTRQRCRHCRRALDGPGQGSDLNSLFWLNTGSHFAADWEVWRTNMQPFAVVNCAVGEVEVFVIAVAI